MFFRNKKKSRVTQSMRRSSDATRFRKLGVESLETRNLLSGTPLGFGEAVYGPVPAPPELLCPDISRLVSRSEIIAIPELAVRPETAAAPTSFTVSENTTSESTPTFSYSTILSQHSSQTLDEELVAASFQKSPEETGEVSILEVAELEDLTPSFVCDGEGNDSSIKMLGRHEAQIKRVVISDASSEEDTLGDDVVVVQSRANGSSDAGFLRDSGGGEPEDWNIALTIDSTHTNAALSSAVRPNVLIERREVSGGATNAEADADFLRITAPALPHYYVATVTFSSTAAVCGVDYQVYDAGFNILGLTDNQTYTYSGGPVVFNVAPINDRLVESAEGLEVSLGNPSPMEDSGGSSPAPVTFTYGTRTVNATIIDDDHWKVKVEATDAVASERLPSVVQDYGEYTFTRVYDDNTVPTTFVGDLSYDIELDFNVYEKPSSQYYSARPGGDYDLAASPLNANDEGVYLSNFVPKEISRNGDASSETLEIFHRHSGTIPAETESVKLRLEPSFDWKDEGDRFNPSDATVANPGVQTGEKVKLTLESATWEDMDNWNAVGSPSVAEVEIKDGAILEEYLDYDGDGNLDVDKSIANEYGSVKLYETDADLRYAKLYAWVGKLECEGDSRYRFDVYQNFSSGSRTSLRLWNDDHRGTLYAATSQNPARRLIGSLEQDGDSVFSDFWLERIEYDMNFLSADADCSLGDENDVFIDVPTYDASDRVAIYDPLYVADIDTDSDNNGYINKEPTPSEKEDSIEGRVGKRITYFPSTTNVPENYKDYMYTEIKLGTECSDTTDLFWSIDYTRNIVVYEKINTGDYLPLESGFKNNMAAIPYKESYYVKALWNSSSIGSESGLDEVHFVLWKADYSVPGSVSYSEVARDTVCFSVQDGSLTNGWIAPNGWSIDSEGNLTTPTPHMDAIGPKDEGSGVELYRGDAFFVLTQPMLDNGFTVSLITRLSIIHPLETK